MLILLVVITTFVTLYFTFEFMDRLTIKVIEKSLFTVINGIISNESNIYKKAEAYYKRKR